MAFPQMVNLSYGMEKLETADKRHPLGTLALLPDGRIYRYVKNSGTALAISGTFVATGVTTPLNTQTITVDVAIGGTSVICDATKSAAGIAADYYEDGSLVITAGCGAGESYRVKSSTARDGTATGTVTATLYDDDAITVALETSATDLDIFPNLYNAVIVNPVDAQSAVVGVNPMPISASYYFWAQVKGVCAVKGDAAGGTVGTELDEKAMVASATHAGQGLIVASPAATTAYWGKPVLARLIKEADIDDNEWVFCFLDLL